MITQITELLIGFSVFGSVILMFAYLFFMQGLRKTQVSMLSCSLLLGSLVALQLMHYQYFQTGLPLLELNMYIYLLLIIPSVFYCFSRAVLFFEQSWSWIDGLHLLPLTIGFLLPKSTVAVYAFMVGTGYTFWLVYKVYELRDKSHRFKFELFFFGLFAAMAFLALLLGLSIPYIDKSLFYLAYSNSMSIAMIFVVSALIIFPDISKDIIEIVEAAYSRSKLVGLDIDNKLAELDQLMSEEKLYQNENLDLSTLAGTLELSPHQLSELINTQFSVGFPRYIREQRVLEAKRILVEEPKSSILSISLMTGFRSQSSFYTAFHEIVGESPGSYRKSVNQ